MEIVEKWTAEDVALFEAFYEFFKSFSDEELTEEDVKTIIRNIDKLRMDLER